MAIPFLDLADLVERPMHRLGLHSYSWVIATALLALLVAVGLAGGYRFLKRSGRPIQPG